MAIIPRKWSNSKGKNFFTEINTQKWINYLMREMRALKDKEEKEKRTPRVNKKNVNRKRKRK